jgi:hypothetical protein
LPGRIHLPGSLREVSALSTDVYIASPFPRLNLAHIALHSAGVAEGCPGEGAELVDPRLLKGRRSRKQVRHVDRELGEVDSVGCSLQCALAALADEELAQPPAHEARIGVDVGKAVLAIEKRELFQKSGRLGAGPGEDGVDQSEDGGQSFGLVKLEQPAADLVAGGTDGQEMEELLVLLGGSVHGEQALHGGGIKMLVLHAFPPLKVLSAEEE